MNALHDEMLDILEESLKPINKQFNALNKFACSRFATLETATVSSSTRMLELPWVVQLMKTSPQPVSAAAEGVKSAQVDLSKPDPHMSPFDIFDDDQRDTTVNATVAPTQGEPHSSGTSNDPNSLAMMVKSDDEPLEGPQAKKLKLFSFSPSQFTPTPLPIRADKGKGIAQSIDESALKMLMPLMEQGGSVSELSILKRSRTPEEGSMTIEEVVLQLHETKRLTDHNPTKDKSEEDLRRLT
ncbi:hypothetical protein Tco_0751398 [Tanacetum coccineum]|uniref:Outer kinetochore protein ASK1 n=1 Tax=Tanacetum coccineum TaxID=301880 RepID=A0ABQ4Z4S3_9ASTR